MDREQIRAHKERRANVWSQAQEVLDEVRDGEGGWTAEREEKWQKLEKDLADLDKTIERGELMLAQDQRDAEIDEEREERTGASTDEYDAIFRRYLAGGVSELESNERKILMGRSDKELRAQGVGAGAAGGYTVPEGFWNRISEVKLAFGNVAAVANVITTDTGNDLPWMTNDDTANEGAILAENVQIGEQDVEFGVRTLGAFLYTSKMVRVSYQLLQDSSVNMEAFLARKFGMRLARIHNRHQTVGTGVAQPEGIVTGAVTGETTAGATDITLDEIINLIHSVDPAYRGAPNVRFMFNDDVLAYVRKIRDDSGGAGLGRPIWEPSVKVGEPSTLYGYPYSVNQHMASIATGNTTMLFGDFQEGYVVRNVKGTSVVRLDERYADFLQVGFFAYDRQDAITDDTNAYKALVQA